MGLGFRSSSSFARRGLTACAIASVLAITVGGCTEKKDRPAVAAKQEKGKPKPAKMPKLSVDCAEPPPSSAHELAKVTEASDLRPPASGGSAQLSSGPVLGAIGAESVKVWIRADRPAPWRVTIWPDKQAKKKRVVEGSLPAQEHDFTSVLAIGELAPATRYEYEVELGAGPDAVKLPARTFRTLPAAGKPGKLRFAVGSQIAGDGDGDIFTQLRATEPDFLVLLGDLIYTGNLSAKFQAYADRHARNWRLPGLGELVSTVPSFVIWDDLEIKKHYYKGSSAKRYAPARLAYELYAQARNPAPARPGSLHYSFQAADVSFFVLDVRSQRANPKHEDGPKKTMLGSAQKADLARFLKCDPGTIKFVVSPAMLGSRARGNDAWNRYKAERDQLLAFIEDEQVDDVIFLTGDQQWSALLKHERDKTTIYELLASPLTRALGKAPKEKAKEIIARDDDQNAFGVVDIDTTVTPATIAFTLCARGKPCKPGEELAPTTGMDLEGEQENVPFTVKITSDDLGPKGAAKAAVTPTVASPDPAPAEATTKPSK